MLHYRRTAILRIDNIHVFNSNFPRATPSPQKSGLSAVGIAVAFPE
jgi:hypothetical protein